MRKIVATAPAFALCISLAGQQAFDLDLSFDAPVTNINGGSTIGSLLVLDDGKVIITGQFGLPGLDPFDPWRLSAKFNWDGTLDPLFHYGFPYVSGELERWNDQMYAGAGLFVRRFDLNGHHDPNFDLPATDPHISDMQNGDYLVFADGSLALTGGYDMTDTANGFVGHYGLVWIDPNGHLDNSRTHRRVDGWTSLIEAAPGGKMFLGGGAFFTYDGEAASRLIRLNADGTRDGSFNFDMGWGSVYDVTTQVDGKVLVSGWMKPTYNSADTISIVRLLPSGSIDSTFNFSIAIRSPYGMRTGVRHHVLEDDRILVFGNMSEVDSHARKGIALLSAGGDLLASDMPGTGCGTFIVPTYNPYNAVYGVVPTLDGQLYIHGAYTGYDDGIINDPGQRFVSRLHGLGVGVREPFDRSGATIHVYPNPATTYATVELEHILAQGELVLRDGLGREVQRQRMKGYYTSIDLRSASGGVYTLEVRDTTGRIAMERLVVE